MSLAGERQSSVVCKEKIGWVEAKVEAQDYPMRSNAEPYEWFSLKTFLYVTVR